MTGATGFIGSYVLKCALSQGFRVMILLRRDSDTASIKDVGGVGSLVYGHLTDPCVIGEIVKFSPEVFIHMGWKGVAGSARNEPYQVTDNVPAIISSVQCAYKSGCKSWVGIGSQAEYGSPNCKADETFPTAPTTLYGKAKLASCWASSALCQAYGLNWSWVRIFSTYGPGDKTYWLIPHLIREMAQGNSVKVTKAQQLWDYLYVEDAARGILAVAQAFGSGIFNLG